MRNQFEPAKLPTFEPLKPLTLPNLNQPETQSVPAKQSFQEFAMAGGGVPAQYKGREHVWHAKVGKHEAHMAGGGLLKGMIKGMQKVLPAAERDANLAKMLEGSAVKDRMYHGTGKVFEEFEPNTRGVHFVTPDPKFADKYAGGEYSVSVGEAPNIMPVYVNAKNPFDYQNKKHVNALGVKASIGKLGLDQIKKGDWNRLEDRTTLKAIKDLGHDGVYVNENGVKNLGVFDPAKIKSATGNRGTYDTSSPDLNEAKGGAIHMKKGGDPLDEFVPPRFRSAGRRPEGQNDRKAAANMPVDFARGAVAGALGAPGDIESLVRMLPGFDEKTFLPTSEDIEKRLPFRSDTPQGRMASGLGSLAGGFYTGPGAPINVAAKGAKMVGKGALKALEQAGTGPAAGSRAAQRGVVKMPSGNFLTGRVEKDVKSLKPHDSPTPEDKAWIKKKREELLASPESEQRTRGLRAVDADIAVQNRNEALNKWVDSNLSNYIKKQMATPDDPVRALAEQGITHKRNLLDEYPRDAEGVKSERKAAGFPEEGMAQSPMAKAWERASDESLATHRAGDIQEMPARFTKGDEAQAKMVAAREELDKKFIEHIKKAGLNDIEVANLVNGYPYIEKAKMVGDTAFLQANDEYRATQSPMMSSYLALGRENPWISKVDPETTIYSPYTGDLGFDHIMDVLREDLTAGRIRPEQMSKISITDAVRRTSQYDQDMAKKMAAAQAKVTEGMPVHKEYPEGYKWIELTKPKDALPEGYKILPDQSNYRNPDNELFTMFDDQGNAVSTGASEAEAIKLYKRQEREKQLADALKYEGETMGHCVGGYCPDVLEGKSRIYSLRDAKSEPHVTVEVNPPKKYSEDDVLDQFPGGVTDALKQGDIGAKKFIVSKLEELNANDRPSRIVQIKGKQNRAPKEEYLPYVQDFVKGGKWADVGDLRNTGLTRKSDLIDKFSPDELDAIGAGEYLTKAEQDELLLRALRPPEEGMAHGGEVHMQVGGFANLLGKGAKAAKKAAKGAEYLPGIHYADPLQPPTMKMSEALGNAGAEGKTLNFTETDRSRVFGPNRGGTGFSGLQHYSLPHKEANTVWGFGNRTTAEKKIRQNDPENTIWTTYAGSPNQHKSNTIVVKDALSQLQSADNQGLVNPKQISFINDRIRNALNDKGKPLFPKDFDITDPQAFDYATTFDRRAVISDALMGIGVKKPMISKEFKAANPGVKWSDAANIDAILRRETDPAMLNANTFDVGPHLFTMDNRIIERPDLNEAFPYQVTGTDLGLRYELAPMRSAAPDWIKERNIKPDEPINAWAMSRAAPSQFVSEGYLTSLQKQGRKKGGAVTGLSAATKSCSCHD